MKKTSGFRAVALSVVVIGALASCSSAESNSAESNSAESTATEIAATASRTVGDESLSILLTNDDGWNAPGITALREALQSAGHEVTVVAPSADKSGTSASANFRGPLTVTTPEPGVWAVDGSPADSVLFGLASVLTDTPPDLVISGSNKGNNTGLGINYSGTVGAAITATGMGVSAIAVSTDTPQGSEVAVEDFAPTADFVAQLVRSLPRERPVAEGTVINVNYPRGRSDDDVKGVLMTTTSRSPFAEFSYVPADPATSYGITVALNTANEDGTDAAAIADGMAAVSVLDVSREPTVEQTQTISDIVADLHP